MDDGDDLSMHSEGKVPGEVKGQWAGKKKRRDSGPGQDNVFLRIHGA